MGSGFSKKKKQARLLQEQFSKLQDSMKNTEVTGSAGGGLVTISMNGEHVVQQIRINAACVDKEDIEGLEDLLKIAFNDANAQLQKASDAEISLPGFSSFGL